MLRSARAKCTQVEHGGPPTPRRSRRCRRRHLLDPNIGLVTQNYLENKARYLGIGNYTEEGFA
jgi:hypothetical protein